MRRRIEPEIAMYEAAVVPSLPAWVPSGTGYRSEVFADIPEGAQAPGEGEIEIYVNGNPAHIEIEKQGPFTNLSPSAESRWSVEWVLSTLPRAAALSADVRLVEHFRSVVKGRVEVEMQGPPSAERRVRERQDANDE